MLFINILKTLFFFFPSFLLWEREEERVVHARIALKNFFKRKVFFEKIMGLYQGLSEKIFKTQTFLKIMGCEKSMKLHQKRKKK